jgi:hypothetical protein
MSALLRSYIAAVLSEVTDYRVPNQLVSKRSPKKQTNQKTDTDKDTEEEKDDMDEMNVVANIVGMTGPLGTSSEDLKGPGAGTKSKKKSSARWK